MTSGDITVLECDALRDVPIELDAMLDVYIGDPPYRPHVHENATSAGSNGEGTRKRDLGFDPLSDALRMRIAYAVSQAKRWGCIFSDVETAHRWREEVAAAGGRYVRTVPWVRWSQPQKSGDRPTQGHEPITIFHGRGGGRMRWNGPGSLIEFDERALRGAEKHPTEKPLDLMLSLVSWFSEPGELVGDYTAGNCTLGLAARLLGRRAVLVERDPKWARAGRVRCESRLSERDRVRAAEWAARWIAEAEAATAKPYSALKKYERRTYERAQRRLMDAYRVAAEVGEPGFVAQGAA